MKYAVEHRNGRYNAPRSSHQIDTSGVRPAAWAVLCVGCSAQSCRGSIYGSKGQAVMQKAVTVKGQHRHAEEVAWLAMKRASSPQ